MEVALGEAHAAELGGHAREHLAAASDHQLGRTATDVDDQARVPCGDRAGRTGEAERSFFDAADHVDVQTDTVGDGVEEAVAVARVTHGGRRSDADVLRIRRDVVLLPHGTKGGDGVDGAHDRLVGEPSGPVHALREPGGGDAPQHAGAVVGEHEESHRVRPDVDSSDAHGRSPSDATSTHGAGQAIGSSVSATYAPTGLSPDAR